MWPGVGHDPDPVRDVRLSTVELIASLGEVVEADDRIVLLSMSGIELDLLREDRGAWEAGIAAAVIEMEVAVHDDADVVGRDASGGEGLIEGTANGVVGLLHLCMALGDAGIEQDEPSGMVDQVATDHDLFAGPRVPVVGEREVTEEDTADAIEGDHRARHSSGQSGSCWPVSSS